MDARTRARILEIALPIVSAVLIALGLTGAFLLPTYVLHEASLVLAVCGGLLAWHLARGWAGPSAPEGSRRRRAWVLVGEVVPPLVVVAGVCGIYSYLLVGEMPWSHDHPVHLFKAWHLGEVLIPSGRLSGWSNYWWTGYPAETLYPMLGDLLVVLVRWASLGLAPWPMAYAWALLLTWLTYHLGIWLLGRRLFGPWVGTLAALFSLLDRGAAREGAYYWTMHYGVWPMALGTALWILSLERFLAVLERPTRGRVVGLAVLLALALLGHPMTMTFTVLVFPMFWGIHALRSERGRIAAPIWASLLAMVVAALVACFWYLPFFDASEYVDKVGGTWWTIPEIGELIKAGALFQKSWDLPIILGAAGIVIAWSTGHRRAQDLSIVACALVLAVSATTVTELDLSRVHEEFNAVHFRRFTYVLKVLWFLLAGFTLAGIAGRANRALAKETGTGDRRSLWRRWAWVAVAALVFTPLVESFALGVWDHPIREISSEKPMEKEGHAAHFRRSNEWFSKNVDDSEPFFRVLYEMGGSRHLFNAAPVYTGLPAVVTSQEPPAEIFNRRFRNHGKSTMKLQNVRYAVTLNEFFASRRDLEEVYREGSLRIYEVRDWSPEPYHVVGEADARLLEFDDERIRIAIEDPHPDARLVLHVTRTHHWRATLDGEPIPIETEKASRYVRWLMSVPLDRSGTLEFRYHRGWPSVAGKIAAGLGLLLLVVIAAAAPIARRVTAFAALGQKLGPLVARASGPALAALAVAVAVGVVVFLASGEDEPGRHRLADHLDGASVTARNEAKTIVCTRVFDRRILCDDGAMRYVYRASRRSHSKKGESILLTGIMLEPFEKLHVLMEFPDVTMGEALTFRCGTDYMSPHARHRIPVEVRIGKKNVGTIGCPAKGRWREETWETERWSGREVDLVVDVAPVPSPTPTIVLDGWIVD